MQYDKAICNIEENWVTPTKKRLITIVGDRGMADIDLIEQTIDLKIRSVTGSIVTESLTLEKGEALLVQFDRFMSLVKDKNKKIEMYGFDALKVYENLEVINC